MMDARTLVLDDDLMLEELGRVRRIALRLLYDPNDADDVVQEAWLRTRTAPVRFESRGRLRAWLVGVARRMALDTLRARRRRAAREERAARLETRADAADVVERSVLLERLLHAVRTLEEPQRSTVLLRYLDGHTTAEIASAMSVSEEVVRKRLARTCAHLRTALAIDVESTGAARRRAGRVVCAGLLWAVLIVAIQGLGQAPRPLTSHTASNEVGTPTPAAMTLLRADAAGPGVEVVASVPAPEPPAAEGKDTDATVALGPVPAKATEAPGEEAAPRGLILSAGE